MHFDPHTGAAGPFEAEGDETLPELHAIDRPPFQWEGFTPPAHHPSDPPVQTSPMLGEGLYDGIATVPDRWIRLACDTARRSVETGGGPFGAVVVQVHAATLPELPRQRAGRLQPLEAQRQDEVLTPPNNLPPRRIL